jgi:DNA repair protein SbcC/Rad50
MIKKLNIRNFQSHEDTTLDFHQGVNVIIGQSDGGKTAVLRALKWVVWNRPGGDAFRSDWGGDTEVTLQVDRDKIKRIKTNATNQYKLNNNEFTAFGTNVPEEITSILNLNEINLQQQLDSPFLLTATPGEVANHFSKVAHLDKINVALKNIKGTVNKVKRDIETTETDIDLKNEELSKYDQLDRKEQDLEVLEQLEQDRIKSIKNVQEIEKLISSINLTNQELEELDSLLFFKDDVDSVIMIIEERDIVIEKIQNFNSILNNVYSLKEQINEYKRFVMAEPIALRVIGYFNKKRDVSKMYNELQQIIANIKTIHLQIKKYKDKINKTETTLHKEMPEVCPLCGTKLK